MRRLCSTNSTVTFGVRPPFRLGAYRDVDDDVRATVSALRMSPFLDDREIRGFVLTSTTERCAR